MSEYIHVCVLIFSSTLYQAFLQEVSFYQPTLDGVSQAEVTLFTSDIATIQSCEPAVIRQAALMRRSSTPRSVTHTSPVPLVSVAYDYTLCVVYMYTCTVMFNHISWKASPWTLRLQISTILHSTRMYFLAPPPNFDDNLYLSPPPPPP